MNNQRFPKLLSRFPALCAVLILFLFFGTTSSFAYYAPLQEVTAWVEGNTVHCKVYDPNLNQWMESTYLSSLPIKNLQVQEGIVAWEGGVWPTISQYLATYDPSRAAWVEFIDGSETISVEIIIKDGIVIFNDSDFAYRLVVYDAALGSWIRTPTPPSWWYGYGMPSGANIEKMGILAAQGWEWGMYYLSLFTSLHVYMDGWVRYFERTGEIYSQPITTDLEIDAAGTVRWTIDGFSQVRGFKKGGWYTGISQPVASFAAPTLLTNGAVWFTDMSFGGTSWHYDFGDGTSTDSRSPFHKYVATGSYIVTQTVTSPNGSDTTTRTVIVDATPPAPGAFLINNGLQYTNALNVTLSLGATDLDSAVAEMRFSNDGTTWGNWLAYASNSQYSLPIGDGTKTVYAQLKDTVGNVSEMVSASIILDMSWPSPCSISINAGANATNSLQVSLALSAVDSLSGVTQMRFYNEALIGSASPWQDYATSFGPWTLAAGEGTKTVTVEFRDGAGNVAGKRDTIIFDTTAPSNSSMVINADAPYTNSQNVMLAVSAQDFGSGVQLMRFRTYDLIQESSWSAWMNYAVSKPWTLFSGDGRKWVEAQFQDAAGNISGIVYDTIVLDTVRPQDGTLTALAGDRQVSLSWQGFTDDLSGIQSYRLYYASTTNPNPIKIYDGAGSSYVHTALAPGITCYYRLCAVDKAGNVSTGVATSATPKKAGGALPFLGLLLGD